MNKFSYGQYDSTSTDIVFDTVNGYVEPASETDTRKELSYPFKEIKDFLNSVLPSVEGEDSIIQFRITESGLLQYSYDGETWNDTASGGHIIYNEDEEAFPQKTRLMFRGVDISTQGDYTVIDGIQGETGVGVASIVQISYSSESGGQNVWRATLTNGTYYDFIVLNGLQGATGEKGDQGDGLHILGVYSTEADLRLAHPTGNVGDAYMVGVSDYEIYVWNSNDWANIGSIKGETGPTGATGPAGPIGVGISTITESPSSVSGGTNVWTITLTNGAVYTFNVKNGEQGSAGSGVPSGGTQGQALVKRTSTDQDTEWADVSIAVDDTLSSTSTNPVENNVIKSALDQKANVSDLGTQVTYSLSGTTLTITTV